MSVTGTEIDSDTAKNILSVDELQNYGINASDLQKLKSGGIYTVNVCYYSIFKTSAVEVLSPFLLLTNNLERNFYRPFCQQQEDIYVKLKG